MPTHRPRPPPRLDPDEVFSPDDSPGRDDIRRPRSAPSSEAPLFDLVSEPKICSPNASAGHDDLGKKRATPVEDSEEALPHHLVTDHEISTANFSTGHQDLRLPRSPPKDDSYQVSVSVDDLDSLRRQNVFQPFVSQFPALPMNNSTNSFLKRPSVGMEGGFLNYFSQNPVFLSFSSDEDKPSTFKKFSTWFKDNLVPSEAERKAFVQMVLEMNGVTMEMSVGPALGRHVLLSIGRIQPSVHQIQNQLGKLGKTASNTEANTKEGVEILKEIRELIAKGDTIVKTVQESGGKDVEVSFLAELAAKLNKFNNSDLAKVLKEVDAAANNVAIPFSFREWFNKMKEELLYDGSSHEFLCSEHFS